MLRPGFNCWPQHPCRQFPDGLGHQALPVSGHRDPGSTCAILHL